MKGFSISFRLLAFLICLQGTAAEKTIRSKAVSTQCALKVQQMAITEETLNSNTFKVNRGIENLFFIFRGKNREPLFMDYLEAAAVAKKKIRWMDWGAGLALPQVEFADLNGYYPGIPRLDVEMHATSYKKPTQDDYKVKGTSQLERLNAAIASGKINYAEADLNNKVDIPEEFNLATDIVGALSYAKNLSQCLRTQFGSLEKGKPFFIHTTNYTARILNPPSKTPLDIAEFLSGIPGLKVKLLPTKNIGTHAVLGELNEVSMVVTKTRNSVVIPELEIVDWIDDIPPIRTFRIKK